LGLIGVVSGRNDSARVEGDDDSSSRWWDKGPRVNEAVFGSKSSRNVSERVRVNARTSGGPVRGGIELETRENTSICVDSDVGRSWGHTYTVLQCVAPKADEADWEWCGNMLESIRFEATRFSEQGHVESSSITHTEELLLAYLKRVFIDLVT